MSFNLNFGLRRLNVQRALGYSSLHKLEGNPRPLDLVYAYDGDVTLLLPDTDAQPLCGTAVPSSL